MIATLAIGSLAVLFAWLAQFKEVRFGLKISYTLIFLFLALRYNFGNDYHWYLEHFIRVNQYQDIDILKNAFHYEPGWSLLCRLFGPIGFFGMVAFLALFNCYVFYSFTKKYVPVNYYWFSVFLFVFSPQIMLTQSSAMRQSLAIALFVFSLRFLHKKQILRYLICVGLASAIHVVALILIPLLFVGIKDYKIGNISAYILFGIYLFLVLFGKLVFPDINLFIAENIERYKTYRGAGELGTGLGILFLSVMFALSLYHERFQNRERTMLFNIAVVGFLFIPFGMMLMMLARVGTYFSIVTIATFPIILNDTKNIILQKVIFICIIIITLNGFFQFFQSPIWRDAFGTYQTIFSASQFY